MSTHTPGPWVASRSGHTVTATAPFVTTRVADVFGAPDRLANARLIAAAPEMLEALVSLEHAVTVLDTRRTFEPGLIAARAAIAKATGEA